MTESGHQNLPTGQRVRDGKGKGGREEWQRQRTVAPGAESRGRQDSTKSQRKGLHGVSAALVSQLRAGKPGLTDWSGWMKAASALDPSMVSQTRLVILAYADSDTGILQAKAGCAHFAAIEFVVIRNGDPIPALPELPIALMGIGKDAPKLLNMANTLSERGHQLCNAILVEPDCEDLADQKGPLSLCPWDVFCQNSKDTEACHKALTLHKSDVTIHTVNPSSMHAFQSGIAGNCWWAEEVIRVLCAKHLQMPIQDLILHQARCTPEMIAVAYKENTLTYHEFCSRAHLLAQHLKKSLPKGKGKGVLPFGQSTGPNAEHPHIAICIRKTELLTVVYMACLLLRLPFCSLDLHTTLASMEHVMKQWDPAYILVEGANAPPSGLCPEVPRIDIQGFLPSIKGDLVPISAILETTVEGHMDDVMFIEFTSGTTGKPKGCEVTQQGMVNWIYWRWFHMPPDTSGKPNITGSNLFFVWYWHLPLCHGGQLSIIPDEVLMDMPAFNVYMRQHKISILECITSSLVHVWLSVTSESELDLPDLRYAIVSGEILRLDTCHLWHSKLKGCHLLNILACTETSADITWCVVTPELLQGLPQEIKHTPIGVPVWNCNVSLEPLDSPFGFSDTEGEICLWGPNIYGGGYYKRPDLNDVRFPTIADKGVCYKGRDVGVYLPWKGMQLLVLVGRCDTDVKVRGFRVNVETVEDGLRNAPGVVQVAVAAKDENLVAFVVFDQTNSPSPNSKGDDISALLQYAREVLEESHVPNRIIPTEADDLKYTIGGKLDRRALQNRLSSLVSTSEQANKAKPQTLQEWEDYVESVWCMVLGQPTIQRDISFFDAGGHSLAGIRVTVMLEIPITGIYEFPTIQSLAKFLHDKATGFKPKTIQMQLHSWTEREVAVIAMAGRFPGAESPSSLWTNLMQGTELLTTFTADEMADCGVPADLLKQPNWMPRGGVLEEDLVHGWDVQFWKTTVTAAGQIDVNQRVMLEVAYEAMEVGLHGENVTNVPERAVGVWACGASLPHYGMEYVGGSLLEMKWRNPAEYLSIELGADKDYTASRISYMLNLTGPSNTIQTACSSGLVCVAEAVRALRSNACPMALAGGVSICVPQKSGYLYEDDLIYSKSGVCRPFDADADGTVMANAAAAILLKPLAAAQKDNDQVLGVIRGIGVNNDGRRKVGFFAPSIQGQVEAVRMAMVDGGVAADTIGYLEAHGTGTLVGDPIEIASMVQAYDGQSHSNYCALGSVKGDIGHANTAAGIISMLKLVLCLHNQLILPLANFRKLNPRMNLDHSPFFIPTQSMQWPRSHSRGAVTSLGMGGTNCHIVAEIAPEADPNVAKRDSVNRPVEGQYVIALSSKTSKGLQKTRDSLSKWVQESSSTSSFTLADLEYTLLKCKPHYEMRWTMVCDSKDSLAQGLANPSLPVSDAIPNRPVVMIFPGQGGQLCQEMVQTLYTSCPKFREVVDTCQNLGGFSILANGGNASNEYHQLRIFVVSYALAVVLKEVYGIQPVGLLGHSLGQYVAACVGGVISLEGALTLLMAREKLMQKMENGVMLAVQMSHDKIQELLQNHMEMEIACVNGPGRYILAGCSQAALKLQETLDADQIPYKKLATTTGFHTCLVEPILDAFEEVFYTNDIKLAPPTIPIACNVSGECLATDTATDPKYWCNHMRKPVQFHKNCQTLARTHPNALFLEVGFNSGLSSLVGTMNKEFPNCTSMATMRPSKPNQDSQENPLLKCIAGMWQSGVNVSWDPAVQGHQLMVPSYAFDRVLCTPAHIMKPDFNSTTTHPSNTKSAAPDPEVVTPTPEVDPQGITFQVSWSSTDLRPINPLYTSSTQLPRFPVILDGDPGPLQHLGVPTAVVALDQVAKAAAMYGRLLIVGTFQGALASDEPQHQQSLCDWVIKIVQSLIFGRVKCEVWLIVTPSLRYSSIWGLAKSLANEHPDLHCRRVLWDPTQEAKLPGDISRPPNSGLPGIARELLNPETPQEEEIELIGHSRKVPRLVRHTLSSDGVGVLEESAAYMITGGLRGLGFAVAEWMVHKKKAKWLILLGRKAPGAEALAKIDALRAHGVTISCHAVDVGDYESLGGLIQHLKQEWEQGAMPKLKGIVHCAGTVDDGVVINLNPARTESVLRPKTAAWYLQHHLEAHGIQLDWLIYFSSSASIWGTSGQSTYSAANTFLDWLARDQCQAGFPTVAIQWGGWGEVGMSADLGIVPTNGENYLKVDQGLECMDKILNGLLQGDTHSEVCVINVPDWRLYRSDPTLFSDKRSPLLEPLLWEGVSLSTPTSSTRDRNRGSCSHPGLGAVTPGDGQWEWLSEIDGLGWIGDHRHKGQCIVPGTWFLEMALAAFKCVVSQDGIQDGKDIELTLIGVEWLRPLVLAEGKARQVKTILKDSQLTIMSRDQGAWVTHMTCLVKQEEWSEIQPPEAYLHGKTCQTIAGPALYEEFSKSGFQFGPTFSLVDSIVSSTDATVTHLSPSPLRHGLDQVWAGMHPAVWDACTHSVCVLHETGFAGFPTKVGRVRIQMGQDTDLLQESPCEISRYVSHATKKANGTVDVHIGWQPTSTKGRCHNVLLMEEMEMAVDGAEEDEEDGTFLCNWMWDEYTELDSAKAADICGEWLLIYNAATEPLFASQMSTYFKSLGAQLVCHQWTELTSFSDFKGLNGTLLYMDEDNPSLFTTILDALSRNAVKRNTDHFLSALGRVWMVIHPEHNEGTLQGAGRWFQWEDQHFMTSLMTLDWGLDIADPQTLKLLSQLLSNPRTPVEVRIKPQKEVHTRKLQPMILPPKSSQSATIQNKVQGRTPYRVGVNPSEGMDGIHLYPYNRAPLKPHDVEILTSHWALNFRDVMVAIGLIPSELGGEEVGIGGECAGIVTRVGSDVTNATVGDTVIALPNDGLGSYVTLDENFVFLKPEQFTTQDAVGCTMAYSTAWLALKHLGRLQKGETILIHSAAGGVGLAAVQIAQYLGAKVIATCSTTSKIKHLRDMGVEHIFSSRGLGFVEDIKSLTDGEGVDMVLNSLSGDPMIQSISLLKPFGRFLEIGKRDQYEETQISLAPFLKGLTYATAHLDLLMVEYPKRARALMKEVWSLLEAGHLAPLPTIVYPVTDILGSLNFFSKGVHIGKILLDMDVDHVDISYDERRYALNKHVPKRIFGSSPNPSKMYLICSAPHPLAWDVADKLKANNVSNIVWMVPNEMAMPANNGVHFVHGVPEVRPEDLGGILWVMDEEDSHASGHNAYGVLHQLSVQTSKSLDWFVTVSASTSCTMQQETSVRQALACGGYEILNETRRSQGMRSCLLRAQIPSTGLGCAAKYIARLHETVSTIFNHQQTETFGPKDNGNFTIAAVDQKVMKRIPLRLQGTMESVLERISQAWQVGHDPTVSNGAKTDKDIQQWLVTFIAKEFGVAESDLNLDSNFDSLGLDSLSVFGLCKKLSNFCGKKIHPADMYDYPTINLISEKFGSDLTGQVASLTAKPRLLCLHGFRTSSEIMEFQMHAFKKVYGDQFELVYVNAPHPATGSAHPDLSPHESYFEWWGRWQSKGTEANSYTEGWKGPYDGLQESLAFLSDYLAKNGPFDGLVGFSQGATMASLLLAQSKSHAPLSWCRFVFLFSPVMCWDELYSSLLKRGSIEVPSPVYCTWETDEDLPGEARTMSELYNQVHTCSHEYGHAIPSDADWYTKSAKWMEEK